MSRRSSRIQGKRRRSAAELDDEQEVVSTFDKRRKTATAAEVVEEEIERTMEITQRRQQFQIKNQWVPISEQTSVPTSVIVPGNDQSAATVSPHTNNTTPSELQLQGNSFRFQNIFTTPISLRRSPLPSFQWADSKEVWQLMLKKEELYVRDPQMLDRHATLQPRMRSILLDWLTEVCEVYRLHRETYYLAVDFIDRYLTVTRQIQKTQLQLIGISCLLLAAKLEEIYPPKIGEFAYVTDGACTENELLDQELVILKALKWDLSPMTTNSWLNVYLQLVNAENIDDKEHNFVFPQYSSHAFVQIARLIDLCFLDIGCLQFTYSVLATSALYHMSSEHVALSVSGYQWNDIAPCVQWMAPFAMTLRDAGTVELKFFPQVPVESSHNIQTHTVDLSMLEKAQSVASQLATSARASPDPTHSTAGIITPPPSKGKNKQAHQSQYTPPCKGEVHVPAVGQSGYITE